MKTKCYEIKLWNLQQKIACNYMMLWVMMIQIQRICVFNTSADQSQESAVLHDHEAVNTSTNMMSWISIIIQFQDHISIWQVRSEVWHTNTIITRFVCKCRW